MATTDRDHSHVEERPAAPAHRHDPGVSETQPIATTGRTGRWASVAVRIVLTLAAAGGMVVAAFLPWARDRAGVDVSIRSLWEAGFSSEARFVATVGFLVIVIGLLAILGLAPRSGWLTVLAGALAVATVVLFAIQLYRAIGSSFLADLGAGGWIALAAGIVAVIGGFFGTRPKVIVTEERAVRVP